MIIKKAGDTQETTRSLQRALTMKLNEQVLCFKYPKVRTALSLIEQVHIGRPGMKQFLNRFYFAN